MKTWRDLLTAEGQDVVVSVIAAVGLWLDERGEASVSRALRLAVDRQFGEESHELPATTRSADLPIGTRLQPLYPGRPDWVVYRKVDDRRQGWCLERAGGYIDVSEIDAKLSRGEVRILTNGEPQWRSGGAGRG